VSGTDFWTCYKVKFYSHFFEIIISQQELSFCRCLFQIILAIFLFRPGKTKFNCGKRQLSSARSFNNLCVGPKTRPCKVADGLFRWNGLLSNQHQGKNEKLLQNNSSEIIDWSTFIFVKTSQNSFNCFLIFKDEKLIFLLKGF